MSILNKENQHSSILFKNEFVNYNILIALL